MAASASPQRIATVAKQAYYRDAGMPAGLARRYYRELAPARVILDLGCGTGAFGRLRPHDGYKIHGIDIDQRAVAEASHFEHARLHNANASPLPYADETFEGVLAKDIFEHVQDPGALAREAYRVMKPGGAIVASVVMARPRRVWDDYTHLRGFTERSARMLLEDAGFRVEAVWRMGGVPLSSRLGLIDAVPVLLRVPVFDAMWGSSWELRARK